jgi:hypothetical protein
MEDRELLELAAKAEGCPTWEDASNCFALNGFYWDPLQSDGDALRLAVKLRMVVEQKEGAEAWIFNGRKSSGIVPFDDDPYAATRRAIVRAAAEIGKAMP